MEPPPPCPQEGANVAAPCPRLLVGAIASLSCVLGCSVGTPARSLPCLAPWHRGAQGRPALSTLSFSASSLHLTLPGPGAEGDPLVGLRG